MKKSGIIGTNSIKDFKKRKGIKKMTIALLLVYVVTFVVSYLICSLPGIGLGLIPAFIAKNKGYNFFLFWLFGYGCLPAAIIVSCVIKNKN